MVNSAQGDLSQLMPENMHILKQISNLNIQTYTECINSLKKQIEVIIFFINFVIYSNIELAKRCRKSRKRTTVKI